MNLTELIRIAELRAGDVLANGLVVERVTPAKYETGYCVDLYFTNGDIHYGHDKRGLTERVVRS